MANNIIDIPLLNPIRFVDIGGPFKGFDDDWFSNRIFDFQDAVNYYQKWQKSDTIKLQFYSNFTPVSVALLNCSGATLNIYQATVKSSQWLDPNFNPYEVNISLASLQTGLYYLLLTAGTSTNQTQLISEPFWVDDVIDNSILFDYKNSENAQGVIFDTGIEFTMRAEGIVSKLTPSFKDTIYQDQILDNVILSSIPFRQFKLMIGGQYGVPDWLIDKVNRILSCDTWLADGKSFVKKDGTQWTETAIENYPMSGWNIDILEASNLSSKRGSNTGDPTQQVAVVYNIETDLFGTFNNAPWNETVQITQISKA
ncbi:MAG: hypothetical protein EPN37_07240 [Chitinophagaceae bacterium]|nr:MAG: hypothetical protein EPN37_07240 [Chitinophagaceae bacterium]